MRKLTAKDIAPFAKILSKIGVRDTVKSMFSGGKTEDGEMISELVCGLIENYPKAENDLFEFIGELTGKTVEEMKETDIDEFVELISELVSGEMRPFLKLASNMKVRKSTK